MKYIFNQAQSAKPLTCHKTHVNREYACTKRMVRERTYIYSQVRSRVWEIAFRQQQLTRLFSLSGGVIDFASLCENYLLVLSTATKMS